MSQKWNLQDIRPAGEVRPRRRPAQRPKTITKQPTPNQAGAVERRPATGPSDMSDQITIKNRTTDKHNRVVLAAIFSVVIIAAAALVSGIFGKTELTIYPEFRDPNINAEFTAMPTPTVDALSYEIMTLEETSESQVQASGSINIQEQATGILEIRKSTPGAERLIKNTRFRSPDGLVYRIQESVVVPGAIDDKAGTIQAEVFADEVGEEYNLAAGTKFDVPGFQEGGFTGLYNAITATNPTTIVGGFNGPQFQIDDAELNTARQALQTQLRDSLLEKVAASKPAGMIAFPGAVAIVYSQLPAIEYGQDLVTIREQATLQIPLFTASDFAAFLAQEAIATYDGNAIRVEDPALLVFNYSSSTTNNSLLANEQNLTFTLTGKPRLIWEYDAEQLTTDLAGLPKTAINNAITAYPGIDRAQVKVTPFWKRTFPEDPADISIVELIDDTN